MHDHLVVHDHVDDLVDGRDIGIGQAELPRTARRACTRSVGGSSSLAMIARSSIGGRWLGTVVARHGVDAELLGDRDPCLSTSCSSGCGRSSRRTCRSCAIASAPYRRTPGGSTAGPSRRGTALSTLRATDFPGQRPPPRGIYVPAPPVHHRLPRAGVDRISCAETALVTLAMAIDRPLTPETMSCCSTASGAESPIAVVSGTRPTRRRRSRWSSVSLARRPTEAASPAMIVATRSTGRQRRGHGRGRRRSLARDQRHRRAGRGRSWSSGS